jgi:ketosteroid isomerase-like protein
LRQGQIESGKQTLESLATTILCFNLRLEVNHAQANCSALFVMLMTFLALAANPADDVKKADQDWAKAAGSKNVDQFMSFIDDDAYVSGNDGKWVHGKQAIRDLWSKMLADPNFKLNWTVDTADVSKDLGYTRGTFSGSMGNQPMSGSYTTVWKKDKSGKWKAIVDLAAPASGQ